MKRIIYFDMDGTLVNTQPYSYWLEVQAGNEEATKAYANIEPTIFFEELKSLRKVAEARGWKIGILTAVPTNKGLTVSKKQWLENNGFEYEIYTEVAKHTDKKAIVNEGGILIDDKALKRASNQFLPNDFDGIANAL